LIDDLKVLLCIFYPLWYSSWIHWTK